MHLKLFLLLFLSFSVSAHDSEWIPLHHDGVTHYVKDDVFKKYKDGLTTLGKSLLTCKKDEQTITHPLTQRDSRFEIKKKGNLCELFFLRDSRWSYRCELMKSEQQNLSIGFLDWSNVNSGIGDFPLSVQEILFNPTICSSEKI